MSTALKHVIQSHPIDELNWVGYGSEKPEHASEGAWFLFETSSGFVCCAATNIAFAVLCELAAKHCDSTANVLECATACSIDITSPTESAAGCARFKTIDVDNPDDQFLTVVELLNLEEFMHPQPQPQ